MPIRHRPYQYAAIAAVLASLCCIPSLLAQEVEQRDIWHRLSTEARINELLADLSHRHKSQAVVFEHVNLLTMLDATVLSNQSVLVQDGVIVQVGATGSFSIPSHALRVDGTEKYLMPGLTDAHVHIGESNAEKLLNIATGVTTVREMASFSWMIPYRDTIAANAILAPNLYLAGPMLNFHSLGIYTQVVRTPEEARQRVQAQKAAGFDFIKVWNNMPLPLLETIAAEAHQQGLDLIGHVPHGVRIDEALSVGMKTLEHFKGYYLDTSLEMTAEDYVRSSQHDTPYWLSPTFATYQHGLKGDTARTWLAESPAVPYVPASVKADWLDAADNYTFGPFGNVPARIFDLKQTIFTTLVQNGYRNFIAGTDNNGANNFMVAGFALHEELHTMAQLGLPTWDVLKAATINAAQAMGKANTFGSIAIGQRADLMLLDQNPLDDLSHLLGQRGVMIRGIWLPHATLENILQAIAAIYQDETASSSVDALLTHYQADENALVVQPSAFLNLGSALAESGQTEKAVALLEHALSRFPSYDVYEALGDAYLSHADTIQALQSYHKSVALYTYNQTAREKLERLTAK